jgi:glyoxylase-like metal-dependent hydrolase (beta-lactamase superfamily II)
MDEVAPGLFYWRAFHEGIGSEVSSYYVRDSGVLIDPLLPKDGALEWLAENGPPQAVLLSNRHHYRHSDRLIEAFGVSVHASAPGMHNFSEEQRVQPFEFGDELPGGVIAHEVGAICPDETALEIPSARALVCADGVVRWGAPDAPLAFVPDFLLGDDPEEVKAGLREAYRRLLEIDFDHLLMAHGLPIAGEGKEQLRGFVEGAG